MGGFRKLLIAAVTLIISVSFIVINIHRYRDRNEVLNDYSLTSGWIVSYRKVGDHLNRTLKYSYKVNGILYSRVISPVLDFKECQKDITLCRNKRFIVIYSNNDHSKSLIDLRNEIDDTEELKLPNELDHFE
jgi:hypothetical protein